MGELLDFCGAVGLAVLGLALMALMMCAVFSPLVLIALLACG